MNHERVIGIQVAGNDIRLAELWRSGDGWRVATRSLSAPHDDAVPRDRTGTATPPPGSPGQTVPGVSPAAPTPGHLASHGPPGDAPLRVAAVPGPAVLTRRWPVPPADADAIRRILANRIDAELPVAAGDLNWGFRRLHNGRLPDAAGDVVVQAARTTAVHELQSRLEAARLRPDLVTTEAEAVTALYRHGLQIPPATRCADILLAATATTWRVAVVCDGVVQTLRRIDVRGGDAGAALRECQQLLRTAADHASACRVFWCATTDAGVTDEMLRQRLRGEITPLPLRPELRDAAGQPLSPAATAEYAVALGLALAGAAARDEVLCLVTHVAAEGRAAHPLVERIARRGRLWATAAGAALLLAGTVHVGALAVENERMRAFLAESGNTNALAALQPKIERMQRLRTYRIDVEGLVADVCRTVPDDVIITSLSLARERRLTIQGVSRNASAVFTMADALRQSGRFADVNPERAEPGQGGGFTISAELARVEPLAGARGGRAPW